MNRIALFVLLAFQLQHSAAQHFNPDSLEGVLGKHLASDTAKVNLLNKLAFAYLGKNPEKLSTYAIRAERLADSLDFPLGRSESLRLMGISCTWSDTAKAFEHFRESIKIADSIGSQMQLAHSLVALGVLYGNIGQDNDALKCYQKTLAIAEELKDPQIRGRALNNLAQVYARMGNLDRSIEHYNRAQDDYLRVNDRAGMASCCSSLGNIYEIQGNYHLAIESVQRGLKIREELNDKMGLATNLMSLGGIYYAQKNYGQSLEANRQALQVAREIGDEHNVAAAWLNIGVIALEIDSLDALECLTQALAIGEKLQIVQLQISALSFTGKYYKRKKDFDRALEFYNRALELAKENGIALRMSEISESMTRCHYEKKQYPQALKSALEGLSIVKVTNQLVVKRNLHALLAQIYADLGNYKEAYVNSRLHDALVDSIYNESNTRQIVALEYKHRYEQERQLLELEHQKKDAIEATRKRHHNIILLSVFVAFLLMSVQAAFIYKAYRVKREANIALAKQNEEVEAKNMNLMWLNQEIVIQQEEITAQRDTVMLQKAMIESQNKEITDSIEYARHIQQAMLPPMATLAGFVDDYFALYKPKNVVSGDFYWNAQFDSHLVLAVADCTGHGVPGAFMSVLGISLINEIARKGKIGEASEMLNRQRAMVIEVLKQKWQSGSIKDGMDMAIVIINRETLELQYAGARIPLFIYSRQDGFAEIKADKQTVAIGISMAGFTNHKLGLGKGDCIYLATDGYCDQLSGPDNIKFKKKQLVQLITEIADAPMEEQAKILDNRLESWKNGNSQTDDVTIVGIRV